MKSDHIISPTDLVLVTGSNGFIGVKVVENLLIRGFRNLRCLVRSSSQLSRLRLVLSRFGAGDEMHFVRGDLLSPEVCRQAAEHATVVYHLAAGVEKSFAGAFMNSALATRNLMDAALEVGRLRRFVNVSSFAVYSNRGLPRGGLLDEACALEDAPQERFDAYCFGKLKQEELVREYGSKRGLPYVILRPGTVYGPERNTLSGRIGVDTFGVFLHLGGSNQLPLTYVDNCADAIVLAGLKSGVQGEVFNIVDDELLTSRQFLKAYKRRIRRFASIPVPYPLAYLFCLLWETYSRWSEGQLPPVFNRRRCWTEWKGNRFSNAKLRTRLGWRPTVAMGVGMERFLSQYAEGAQPGQTDPMSGVVLVAPDHGPTRTGANPATPGTA